MTVYNLDLGAIGASGTITTDGVIGDLTATDITDYSIVLHAPGSARTDYDITLTPQTYYITSTFGPDLNASATGLTWNFGATDGELFQIFARSEPPGCECWLIFQQGGIRVQGSNFVSSMDIAGPLTIASVPEPATWALILLGFMLLGMPRRILRS